MNEPEGSTFAGGRVYTGDYRLQYEPQKTSHPEDHDGVRVFAKDEDDFGNPWWRQVAYYSGRGSKAVDEQVCFDIMKAVAKGEQFVPRSQVDSLICKVLGIWMTNPSCTEAGRRGWFATLRWFCEVTYNCGFLTTKQVVEIKKDAQRLADSKTS